MKFLAYFRSLAAKFFYHSKIADDMDEELLSHIQHRADDLERSGLSRAEAERRARIEFGGQERYKEESYEALGGRFIETLVQDARFSLRRLRKSPGFTVVAVLTLACAIGANAVVFSVLNAFLLRPLNVPQPESLYAVWRANVTADESYPDYLELRDRNRSFDDLVGFSINAAGLDTGENPSRVWIEEVSGNYFDGLRIQPYLGQFFHASDEHGPNSAPYIVLNHTFWRTRFHEDRSVVGRVVQVNKHPFTILGVAPPGFHGTLLFFNPDFFVPMVNQEQVDGESYLNTRAKHGVFMVMGHLKAGVTPAQASADLTAIGAYLEKTYAKDDSKMTFGLARPSLYGDHLGRPVREFMTVLMALAGLILLAACANLGSLFAARASDRSREVALRLALGAGRKRILRGLFTEAVLISLSGGAAGLWLSIMLLHQLSAWQPFSKWPLQLSVNPDANVYAVALLLALVSGFLFGAVPVRQVLHTNAYEVIKSGSTGKVGRQITVRDVLLVVQIAICAVLVTSSIVAVRGLMRSMHSDFGFDPQNVMLAGTDLAMGGYRGDKLPEMQKRMIEALEAVPGVESVGMTDWTPLNGNARAARVFTKDTVDLRPGNAAAVVDVYSISPGYFRAAHTALLEGRPFTWNDDKGSPPVAVINRELARTLFGSVAKAVGGYYKNRDGIRIQVVGIAEDGKYESLTEDPQPAVFLPVLQSPASDVSLVVRSSRDPQQLGAAIRNTLRGLDAGLPVYTQTWEKDLDIALFSSRMATLALGVLGMIGAILSITGIFGMAAFSVSKRLRELGIRVALGAQRKEVLLAALGRTLRLLAFGSAGGLIVGILASRVLAFVVYQATPRDPVVLAGVILAMLLLGLVAIWIPARRVLLVDPLILLRED